MVYPYVLTSHRQINYPDYDSEYGEHATIPKAIVRSTSTEVDPMALELELQPARGRNDCKIYPEILATCKTINREAKLFLSQANETQGSQ